MTEEQHDFIEDMGQLVVGWGLPRNTGRIYGYLLLHSEPASLAQVAAQVGIAPSGVSVATRQLVQLGLARGTGQRGSKRLLYEALLNLEAIIAARTPMLVDLQARLRQGARAAQAGPGRRRLEDMADMVQELQDELPALVRRISERRQE